MNKVLLHGAAVVQSQGAARFAAEELRVEGWLLQHTW